MYKKVLLIDDDTIDCINKQKLFHQFDKIICDYETNPEEIKQIDFNEYDIIIYDIDLEYDIQLPESYNDTIFIAKSNEQNEEVIDKYMQNGFDMFVIEPYDCMTIKHILLVCNLINIYKDDMVGNKNNQ